MNILMFTHNLDEKNGGMTFALKTRAEVLSEYDYNVFIVTHGFSVNPQLKPKGYQVDNIYRYFSKQKGQVIPDKPIFFSDEILYKDKNNKSGRCFRVFSEGEYKQYRQYNQNGELTVIDLFELPWKCVKKYLFQNEKLVKIFYMDDTNKPKLAKYIYQNNCYMTTVVDPRTWKDLIVYNHTNQTELKFEDFKIDFLKKYIANNKIDVVFIDKREDVSLFLKIKEAFPNIKLIFVLHSNHYKDYVNSKGLHESLHPLFNSLEKFYKVVILTYAQKEAIVKEFGNEDKFQVVSNIIEYENLENIVTSRKNLISIGRYEDVKNMKDMIEVFKLVSKEIKDVRLDLYGYGSQKEMLKEQAKGYNIHIHEFSKNPREIMQKSSAFLFTSKYEGHPLVLLECYDAQCPIFSYDINFGPSEIIEENENGIIIENRDINLMAQKIIDYINGKFNFKFDKRCSEVFSKEKYIQFLISLFSKDEK